MLCYCDSNNSFFHYHLIVSACQYGEHSRMFSAVARLYFKIPVYLQVDLENNPTTMNHSLPGITEVFVVVSLVTTKVMFIVTWKTLALLLVSLVRWVYEFLLNSLCTCS